MKRKLSWPIFWALVVVFVANASMILIGMPNAYAFFIGIGVLFVLGVALLFLTIKTKVSGTLKKFLLLTGASAVGLPVFAVLHNLVYALLIVWFGEDFWGASGDEPVFFILAVIVCPIAFLVGAVGSIVLAIKNKPTVPTGTS